MFCSPIFKILIILLSQRFVKNIKMSIYIYISKIQSLCLQALLEVLYRFNLHYLLRVLLYIQHFTFSTPENTGADPGWVNRVTCYTPLSLLLFLMDT